MRLHLRRARETVSRAPLECSSFARIVEPAAQSNAFALRRHRGFDACSQACVAVRGTTLPFDGLRIMRLRRSAFILCFCLFALPAAAQPFDPGWTVLTNRQGARVNFPRAVFSNEREASVSNRTFSTSDERALFTLFSVPNTRRESPSQFARRQRADDRLTYRRVSHNFIAASTRRDGKILYRRCNFSGGNIHCIDVRYPIAEKRAWDDIVTRISLSLRPR
jgi:hypothetical protein